jgi:hypothetical protein
MNDLLQDPAALTRGKYLVPITINISLPQSRLDVVKNTISGNDSTQYLVMTVHNIW